MGSAQVIGDLTGRTALVTGASEGIGRGLALGMAHAGADIIACSRRLPLLEALCEEIRVLGRTAEARYLDVSDLDSIELTRQYCAERSEKIDILVNNAGLSIPNEAWSVSADDWDAMMNVGLRGVFFCSQAIGSLMRQSGYGKIINLSSTVAQSVIPGSSVYATVKAGVSHLTRALAVEWAKDGIRVNALAPATTPTPSRMPGQTEEKLATIVSRIPLARQGNVDDLIPSAVFLASGASDFMTGQTIFVDGGWNAAG